MSLPPIKTEQYQNIGGINRKASPFMTGTNEALEVLNFDYTKPGAYTTRPGTTPIISGFTGAINSFYEFSRLNGSSYKIFSNSSQLYSWNGVTSTAIRTLGATVGATFIGYTGFLNFAPFVDRLFVAGGPAFGVSSTSWGSSYQGFFKTDGLSMSSFYSLPSPDLGIVTDVRVYMSPPGTTQGVMISPGLYQYSFAFINDRGYMGPIATFGSTDGGYIPKGKTLTYLAFTNSNSFATIGSSTNPYPGIQFWIDRPAVELGFVISPTMIPQGYGISYVCVFRSQNIGISPPAGFSLPYYGVTYLAPLYDVQVYPLPPNGGLVVEDWCAGVTALGFSLPLGVTLGSQQLWFTATPKYLEIYNNSLFMCGFTGQQSTVYFSAIGEPELVGATQSFEVRTNDSDIVTGQRSYLSQLILFKNRSFHSLTGDAPSNYGVREVSSQYGLVSNRATAIYEDVLFFLDQKGICSFNGAATEIISNRDELQFRRMNLPAARDQAMMIHVKDRNEIWTIFPIDGATYNNYIVGYDYLSNGFWEWFGPQPASIGLAFNNAQKLAPFYGDFSGVIQYFSASLWTDSGRGFTCSVTPRYFGGQGNELGYSVEKMFRRAYFDITDSMNPGGVTNTYSVAFMADFVGFSTWETQTFAINTAAHRQPRLDFGIPGKAMTYTLSLVPNTPSINFNGYTIEYRYQRNV